MKKIPYPLFLPPDDLAKTPAKEWTAREAKAYLDWMLDCLNERVEDFLQYLDEPSDQSCEPLLKRVGEKLGSTLQHSEFYIETLEGRRLSNAGYAIAADAGLLVGQCLIAKGNGKIHWEILRKPKSALSFNLPVLMGFTSKIEFDPIQASIAQASGVIRDTAKKDRWLMLYERNK